jgi:flagellar protein FliS
MSFTPQYAADAYAKVGIETSIAGADPQRLILMLFEGAEAAVAEARRHMEIGNIARKGESVSKAIRIIQEGLVASLDPNAGGPLAQNLSALYEYMARRLLLANAKNRPEILDEVHRLLGELKGAWAALPRPAGAPQDGQAARPAQRPY